MTQLLAGLFLFFGIHSISILNHSWRDQLAAKLGEYPWKGIYSLVSLAGLIFVSRGFAEMSATASPFYSPPGWLGVVSNLLMVAVFPLLVAAYFPGKIKAWVRHPMLLATMIWALAHLLSSGTAAGTLLFGTFLAWAAADWVSLERRPQRPIPGAPENNYNDLIAVIAGLTIYGVFLFYLHEKLLGIAIL
jgi:uncharacterized membrane protein